MKSFFPHALHPNLLCISLFWISACGIPKEQHQATLDELKSVKSDMATKDKSCKEQNEKLTKQNEILLTLNKSMKDKLLSLGQDLSKLETQAGTYLHDISDKEKQIGELLKAQEAARARTAMFRDLLSKFKSMIDTGKLKVEIRKGRMIVKMSDKVLFDPGKADLKKEGMSALVEVSKILAGIPDRVFQVAGHTDNWELSTARAVIVVKFMSENGMDPNRLSAAGYGPFDAVADNSQEEGRALNRRIEITFMPSIEELPKITE